MKPMIPAILLLIAIGGPTAGCRKYDGEKPPLNAMSGTNLYPTPSLLSRQGEIPIRCGS